MASMKQTDKYLNFKENLMKFGDHLYTLRGGYSHHGIYAGSHEVVHYSGLVDGLSKGPIESTLISEFSQGYEVYVNEHSTREYGPQETVERARSKIGENSYNIIFDNCEHFVNWCIFGHKSSHQVKNLAASVIASSSKDVSKYFSPNNLPKPSSRPNAPNASVAITAAVVVIAGSVLNYMKGNINNEQLLSEVSQTTITSTSSFYCALVGQSVIPIPGVGAFIGSIAGYFIGNMIHQSCLIALGDSHGVKIAKERREYIEAMCLTAIPIIKENRAELEKNINKYFSDRKAVFCEAFNVLDASLGEWNPDAFALGLESINNQFEATLQYKNFNEFDVFMNSNKKFQL